LSHIEKGLIMASSRDVEVEKLWRDSRSSR